jgi:membrane protein YqaA with SNARE-associated domain
LNTIKHILAKYTAFLWAVLKPLGIWGVFGFAAVDSALLGMPLDPIVAGYVYSDPHRSWMYVLMAAAGSAVGSMVIYAIGYAGGEVLLHRRMSQARFERIRRSFDQHEFLALMLPAVLPPPFPFKLVALSAAAFEMSLVRFLLAIFAGRLLRFGILAVITIRFGPQVLSHGGRLLRQYGWWVLAGIAVAVIVWYVVRRARRARVTAHYAE